MYAIVEFAGAQVKVEQDKIVEVPKIQGKVGDLVESEKVLFLNTDKDTKIGSPYVSAAKVKAKIYAQDRTAKTIARVYKRRKQFKKTWGFRRDFTLLKITDINS